MKIGVIGGIGSGKSTAMEIIKELGYKTYSCDAIYAQICETQSYIDVIAKKFPGVVENNIINKKVLGEIVFNDPTKLALLNSIAHPLIKNEISKLDVIESENVYIEVPVYEGSGLENFFDRVILITADTKIRIDRVIARNGFTKEHAKKIIMAQTPDSILQKDADYIVMNNKGKDQLRQQLAKLL